MARQNNWGVNVGVNLDTSTLQRQLNDAFKNLKTDFNLGKDSKTGRALDETAEGLRDIGDGSRQASNGMGEVSESAKDMGLTFQEANLIMSKCLDTITDMIDKVRELDSAIVEFSKVSDIQGKQLDDYLDKLGDMGSEVARTTKEMLEAATNFKKMGFTEDESAELAKISEMYRNIADEEMSAGQAADFIIAQLKAFNLNASESLHIIDAVNKISNEHAVSSADLANNIGKASAALAVGGNKYEEVLALLTAGTEVTQSASRVARGLVTTQSRLLQILDEESSTGKKLTEWYREHNIAIYDQEGQLRKLYDILKDVAEQWDDLDTNTKDYYLNIAAGANQSQNLAAILSNFGTVISATEKAYNSTNSAMKENERVLESVDAKQRALTSAYEDFANKVIDSRIIKDVLSGITEILKFMSSDIGVIVTQFALVTGTSVGFLSIGSKIITHLKAITTALGATAGAATALQASLGWVSLAIGVVTTAVLAGVSAYKDYQERQEEIYATANELKNSIDSAKESFEKQNEEIDATVDLANKYIDRLEELQKQEKLSNEQKSEMYRLVGLLNELIPDLGVVIDETTGKLNIETNALRDNIGAWKDKAYISAIGEQYGKISGAYGEARLQKSKTQAEMEEYITKTFGSRENYEKALELYKKSGSGSNALLRTWEQQDAFKKLEIFLKPLGLESKLFTGFKYAFQPVLDFEKSISAADEKIAEAEKQIAELEKLYPSATTGDKIEPIKSEGETDYDEPISKTSGNGYIAKSQAGKFESAYKALKHKLTTGQISEKDYYDQLEKLYMGAFSPGTEDFWKYEEEVYKGRTGKSSTTTSSKSSKDDYLQSFKDILAAKDHQLAMDEITEEEYYDYLEKLYKAYFEDRQEYQEQYWTYEEKIYQYRKKQAEDLAKAAKEALEAEKELAMQGIEEVKDAIDKQVDSLKDELDVLKEAEDAINDKYDAELEGLQQTNNELEKQLEYERLLEEMAKAKASKKLVYKDGQYQYVSDADAISAAQSNIDAYNRQRRIEAQKADIEARRAEELAQNAKLIEAKQAEIDRWSGYSSNLRGVSTSMSDTDIIALMKANSNAWNLASTDAERNQLHNANVALSNLLTDKMTFNSSSGRWSGYANGTLGASGGLSLVGERGAELRMLNKGDGIIPAELTKNLFSWGEFKPVELVKGIMEKVGGSGTTISIGNIELPSVSNAQQFLDGLKNLALQYTYQRA